MTAQHKKKVTIVLREHCGLEDSSIDPCNQPHEWKELLDRPAAKAMPKSKHTPQPAADSRSTSVACAMISLSESETEGGHTAGDAFHDAACHIQDFCVRQEDWDCPLL